MPRLVSVSVPKLDLTGFLLVGSGLAATIFGLTTLSRSIMPPLMAPLLTVSGIGLLAIYVVHARRIPNAILDLRLLRVETFRSSVLGGSLFRIGAGAIPFLLPLLLQVGFGLNAFQTGLLMFASAIGAMSMKMVAARVLRRFGFRRVLIVNVLIGSALLGANALLTEHTPYWAIFALFLTSGFFRSLQFTSVNALAYADMGESEISRASTFSNVAQQLSASLGVALAAFVVEAALAMDHGRVLGADELRLAFLAVAAVSACAIFVHLGLTPEAGHALSGHGRPHPKEVPAE
jgi:MFS family permease